MLTTEDIDRMKYPEIGKRFIEDCDNIPEEICKHLILFIADYTWVFIWGQCMIISIYMGYFI